MSGPKVVRIITRDEILEICHGVLARVDTALAEWIRIGQRNECVDDDAIATARARRDALAALMAADRFMDFQKQAPIEEAFLRDDLQRRLSKVAAEQAVARSRDRREREVGANLLRTLRQKGATLDPQLAARLERGDTEAISEGLGLLAENSATTVGSQELANQLREEGADLSLSQWSAGQPFTDDPAIERIELRIAQLATMTSDGIGSNWRSRLDEAATADQARRGLLLDGLDVETGRALTEARQRDSAAKDFDLLLAELDAAGLATINFRAGAEKLNATELMARCVEAQSKLDAHRADAAGAARRKAMLTELSALGYEVIEGMATSWAEDGKVVLKNATRPDYGVELSAAGGGQRMQMRAVAFDTGGYGPDPARDRDAESIWCGDVSTLQDRLATMGGELVIEKALPVGATPLKRVKVERDRHVADETAPLRGRTLGKS